MFGRVDETMRILIEELKLPSRFQVQFNNYMPTLTDVQKACLVRIKKTLETDMSIDFIAVTGAGKTEIVLALAFEMIREKKIVAFVCPRVDVIRELDGRVRRYFPEYLIVSWHEHIKTPRLGHFYIMTMHQLIHYQAFFDLVIIDEADAFPFIQEEEDVMLRYLLMRSLKSAGKRIYMTATPKKEHGKPVYLMTKFNQRPLPMPRFFHITLLEERIKYGVRIPRLKCLLAKRWLLFVPSIKKGELLFAYLMKQFKTRRIAFTHSRDQERNNKIEKFRQKGIDILVTTSILERGVTFDDISVAAFFLEDPLFTVEMIVQICGRVDRGAERKLYFLEMYYGSYCDKIKVIRNTIKGMNERSEVL